MPVITDCIDIDELQVRSADLFGGQQLAEPQTEEHVQVTIDDRSPDGRCEANWARLI